ncbi:aldehyde dehydrogenase family protein [Pseudarthrobacter raffinosi]|uniref:aldehyde dehydrogenase family protein n=1 Tax=Pseudarthrobacter raffinosi TaxID=2953651 RepID=UPI00208E9046|nr:aldehyde dehydrogenase family protein [Pseudarthrobacter sp. MDT3-9]MCO4251236.1 aldehyde dehydrogenase family protein [Pseudarthrobacter sp. MDT3-9]
MTITSSSTTPTRTETRHYSQLIGGEWVQALDGATLEITNPYDDSVFATVPASTRADTEQAVRAASAAQKEWAEMLPATKQQLFLRAADILESRTAEIVRALAEETGCGAGFAHFQISWSANLLRQAAGWVYQPNGELLRTDNFHTFATAERKPLGVVASFTPWNGAHVLAWRAVVAPLATGNTVVVKPSELAPVTAGLLIGEILTEAGFPKGTVNIVTHSPEAAADVAEEFYENPAVRCIYFTGSANTARIIAPKAAAALKRTVLELGGYNQIIVADDADLDHAAKTVAFSAFFHQGQICMNARRVLVHRTVCAEFTEKLVQLAQQFPQGDPSDPITVIGPLITDGAVQKTVQAIEDATRAGARVLTGGKANGRVFEPTVLIDVPANVSLASEETFGPVIVVHPIDSDEEGVAMVNEGSYGLSFSVMTADIGRGINISQQIDSGAVHVNAPTINDEPQSPNGGVKDSGWGRSGLSGLDDFTEIRWTTVEMKKRELPL